ncbi:hypothetical protein LCGC14_2936250, partial [marine sediment metagenome]
LTMATGLKAAITWVVLDEAGNRVHESSRSDVAAFQVLSNQNMQTDKSGLSDDPRATHWSGYVSELDGSEILRRTNTTIISTDTFHLRNESYKISCLSTISRIANEITFSFSFKS